jgi:hypothetical protein
MAEPGLILVTRCELAATGETVCARTVERHLPKIFIKLGIGSRRELHTARGKLGPDRPAA